MKIIITLSGGADSVLAAIRAKQRWPKAEFYPIFINYGQICADQEYFAAFNATRKLDFLNIPTIKLEGIWTSGGMISGETNENQDVYTPLRNLAFLGVVIAYADTIGANIIVTGSKGLTKIPTESHSYYDSTVPFAKLMEAVWNYTTENKRQVQIIPILAEGRKTTMTKEEVYKELVQNGFGFKDTWSCFKGGPTECGECVNCLTKKRIFKELDGRE